MLARVPTRTQEAPHASAAAHKRAMVSHATPPALGVDPVGDDVQGTDSADAPPPPPGPFFADDYDMLEPLGKVS